MSDTTHDTSLLMRAFWDAFEAAKGRRRTMRDLDDPRVKVAIQDFVKKYLPELRKIRTKAELEAE